MRFKHKKNVKQSGGKRWLNKLLLVVSIACFAGGIYLLVLVLTPNVPVLYPVTEINPKTLPKPAGDRVYIPKIGVDVPINTGGPEALNDGAWHRYPERGDPVAGGNFILSAHRFSIGLTPGETKKRSPFYHINKLKTGDQILIDFGGKRYGYEITKHTEVKPTQVEIEAPLAEGEEPHMTLYTCTLKGEADGREVYYAKPLGEVDSDGNVTITTSSS